tara:strand:- start:298 stop:1362 length:1065 start_codon:yes stop_codon:yes gene_type:complete
MGSIKLPHASGNSMSIAAPATNPASDLELKLPATIGTANQLLKNSGTAGTLEFSSNLTFDGNLITGTHTSGNVGLELHATGSGIGNQTKYHNDHGEAYVGQAGDTTGNLIIHNSSNTPIQFSTNGSERARIEANGNFTTTGADYANRTVAGFTARAGDSVSITRATGSPVEINRQNDDGTMMTFYQGNSHEGNISVSGSTVSYNGGHLSRWSQIKGLSQTDKSARPTIYQGTVMSNLDDLCEWEGEENQQLNMTKISDVDGDKDVAGVFWAWDDDDDKIVNDFYVAMTGDMVIRVAASTTVARGDLLISAGDGTAKPQADDIVRSSTIAKIISTNSTATYEDGSKAYPCVLMAC